MIVRAIFRSVWCLAVMLSWMGCGDSNPPAAQNVPLATTNSAINSSSQAATNHVPNSLTVTPEVAALRESFEDAEPATKDRIEDALRKIEQGRTSEGIRQLKTVEADSRLSSDQSRRIIDVIRSLH